MVMWSGVLPAPFPGAECSKQVWFLNAALALSPKLATVTGMGGWEGLGAEILVRVRVSVFRMRETVKHGNSYRDRDVWSGNPGHSCFCWNYMSQRCQRNDNSNKDRAAWWLESTRPLMPESV